MRSTTRKARATKARTYKTHTKKARTRAAKKQFRKIENAVIMGEGKQSLARFGHTGEDKFKEEVREHAWLHNVGKKNLQQLINKHYYKFDSSKRKPKRKTRRIKNRHALYPTPHTRRRTH